MVYGLKFAQQKDFGGELELELMKGVLGPGEAVYKEDFVRELELDFGDEYELESTELPT